MVTETITIAKAKRNSGIELLRIMLIFMIVVYHVLNNSALSAGLPISSGTLNYSLSHLVDAICAPAVDCFIIISGFFTIKFAWKKIIKIIIMLWFFGLSAYIVLTALGYYPFTWMGLLKANVPTVMWFIQYYVILFFASPILNITIKYMTKKQHQYLLFGMLVFFSLVPTFSSLSLSGGDRGFGIINFIFMYYIGSYISKYSTRKSNRLLWASVFAVCIACVLIGNYFITILTQVDKGCLMKFYAYDCLFVILAATSLFMLFKDLQFYKRLINTMAACVLGIYVIHEQPLLNQILYTKLLNLPEYYEKLYFVGYVIVCALVIFVGAMAIEFVRIKLLGKIEDKIIYKLGAAKDKFVARYLKKAM
jgi:surface polysaccharide O-acyltransferase-like enzyme